MREFAGYRECTPIYESHTSLVFRGHRERDGLPVMLKLLKGSHPGNRELARYRHEFELLDGLGDTGVITVHALEQHGNSLLLVLEDFGAESLKNLLGSHRFTLEELLQVFATVADTLSLLHRRHIVHKDVNPSNIVYNPATGQCKLIDFGLASHLSPTNPGQSHAGALEGTLAYISPEQTGRMNRQLDYRSDLYSLGVSLYELLTGRLPFETRNSLELVHSHIAGIAASVHESKPDVPPTVSDIVARLMAKTAEQRYQSARGLKADLDVCLQQLHDQGRVQAFELGVRDRADAFYLPQKLYGRETAMATLYGLFEQRVSGRGASAFLLVSGYSGTGKTSLVKEIYKPLSDHDGWFIEGKFDQYQRSTPYSAMKQALGGLVDGWLATSEEVLRAIAADLNEAMGEIGGVMVEMVPALELVVGPQPPVPVLAGVEAQNRFNYACQRFFRCVATAEHPLVLFIDDLHWADLASLNLLSLLLTDSQLAHLFLIGAYRDNETAPEHPLMRLVERLAKAGIRPATISLGNLSRADLAALSADALHSNPQAVDRLAGLIHAKTQGNPFFVTQFLKSLHDDGLIAFDGSGETWNWDIERIERRDIPDDVVRLMVNKITTFSPQTQRLLTLSACIGNAFELDTLAVIHEQDAEPTRRGLAQAVREGLLIPQEANHYRFSHDRFQQAAYSLMVDGEQLHLRIGRLLLAGGEPTGERVFQVANQLNMARRLISDPGERLALVELNLKAGRRAKSGTAHSAALKYLLIAAELLPAEAWSQHYALTFAIFSELAWCRFYAGESEGIEELFEQLLGHARGLDDQVRVHGIRMEYYQLAGDYARAVEIQKEALRLLGVDIDESEIGTLLQRELEAVPGLLGGRSIEELQDSPPMDSPRQAAVMDILMGLWTSAYLDSRLELVAWSSCKMTNISLQYGNSPLTSYGFMNYAFVCVAMLDRYEDGHRFGQVAIRLAERYDNLLLRGKAYLLFAVFVNHWHAPLAGSLNYSLKSFPLLAENGDWTYAGYCAEFIISDATIWGMRCDEILEEAERYLPFLRNNAPVVLEEFVLPACLNPLLQLLGRTRSDHSFDDERFQEQVFLRDYRNNPLALSYYYTAKLRSLYWFDHLDDALAMVDQVDFVASVALAQAKVSEAFFYASLTILACFERLDADDRERLGGRIEGYQEKMRLWADNSPVNFRHKYLLVEAERARVAGREWEALEFYEAAIEEARKGGYLNNEALAYECAARFFLARTMTRSAAHFMREARYAYHRWGAVAKVRQLEGRYIGLFALSLADRDSQGHSLTSLAGTGNTLALNNGGESLDILSIVQASQSLAGEIGLDGLLEKMMKIATLNAGADRCVLLQQRDGKWRIQAETKSGWELVSIPRELAVQDCDASIPMSLINYCARKQESLVLGNAAVHGRFSQDPYFAASAMKSVLSIPLLHSGTLKGVLYLENSLVEEAFTSARLRVLELLSSQMAISIDNARFYRELEHRVEQRTGELVQVNAELQEANQKLEALSNIDGLTQIANRRMLDGFIGREWLRHLRMRHEFALILCDIDYFKRFNDTYGHVAGDHCLHRVAQAIKEAARRPGDLVARYGGEEFAVVLAETGLEGVHRVIEAIQDGVAALRIPHAGSDLGPYVTLSLGALQSIPPEGTKVRDALASADRALYIAKTRGRNCAVIEQEVTVHETV